MRAKSIEHVVVFRDERYFAAWPFNGGFWQFADGELAAGFVRGRCDYTKPETLNHGIVDCDHGEHVILRSRDGGRTWPTSGMATAYTRPAFDLKFRRMHPSVAAAHGFDPRADGFCLICGFGIPPGDGQDVMFAMVSTDRGATWNEPVRLPTGRFAHLGGRPSYVVRRDGLLLLFGHGSRARDEGTSVPLVFGSWDGGASWGLLAEMMPVPPQPMAIMPNPIVLDDGTILAVVRRQYDGFNAYSQVYASRDDGRAWSFLSRVNDWGAPAALAQLPDTRIVCAYGYRQVPWGIRARVSEDRGATWGGEIVLRDDGGSWDLGYPRMLLRPDGSLITVYYFNSASDSIQCHGGVRHIAATLWRI